MQAGTPQAAPLFLEGGGELGRLIAAFAWEQTPLGALHAWPPSRRAAVSLMLGARVPMVTLWGDSGVMIYNDAYAVFAAARHPQLLGADVRDGWPEVADFNDHMMKVVLAGGSLTFEDQELTLLRTGRAEQVWMNLDYSPLRDDEGTPVGVIAIVVETTAKIRAEAAARLKDDQFRTFAEVMSNHVWAALPDGRLDWLNPSVGRYSGLEDAAVHGDGWAALVHPDDLPEAKRRWDDALSNGTSYEVDMRLRRRDGVYRWHITRAVPLRDDAGNVVRWVGTNTDIEEQKAAAAAVNRLNQLLGQQLAERTADRDRMWQLSTDVMLVADFEARIVSVNPAWTRLLGWSITETTGRNVLEFVHPDDHEPTLAEVAGLVAGVTLFRFENRWRHRDGPYRRLSWAAVPDERFIHAVGRDVTAEREAAESLKRSEAALQQAQKMESVGQLTGGVAHDFNNLLQVISANLQLLARRTAGDERNERYVASALAGVRRGARLASQLLAFARRQPLEPKVVGIGRLVAGMEELLRRTLGESIEIETVVSGGLWNCYADPAQVENALLNLSLNARDAMGGVGRMTIEAGNALLDEDYVRGQPELVAGQFVVLTVTDNGAGIPQELIGRIFEPFFSTKPEGQGTGLGLSMVYGFVKQSGGHVKVYSEIGQGTAVKIYLPRALGGEAAAVSGPIAPVEGGTETVLVAEDDDEVRATVVEMLRQLGYAVHEARDAASALGLIEGGLHIDLLFTDVVMPGTVRSPDLARRAKQRLPKLAVLFTSGYTRNAIVHGGRLDPGVELIGKPYTQDALAQKIRRLLAAQRSAPAAGRTGASDG